MEAMIGLFDCVVTENILSQILRNMNFERYKGFDAVDNNSTCTDCAPVAIIIIKKVNRHSLTFSWIKANVIAEVEPRYNEPPYNEVLGITNDFLCPSSNKIYGKEPRCNETSL